LLLLLLLLLLLFGRKESAARRLRIQQRGWRATGWGGRCKARWREDKA